MHVGRGLEMLLGKDNDSLKEVKTWRTVCRNERLDNNSVLGKRFLSAFEGKRIDEENW